MQKLDQYLVKRKEIIREEKAIAILMNVEKELYLLCYKQMTPQDDTYQEIASVCHELRGKLHSRIAEKPEYSHMNEMPLNSLDCCYFFIHNVIRILKSTRKRGYPWYMTPLAATLTLGETLILSVLIALVLLL